MYVTYSTNEHGNESLNVLDSIGNKLFTIYIPIREFSVDTLIIDEWPNYNVDADDIYICELFEVSNIQLTSLSSFGLSYYSNSDESVGINVNGVNHDETDLYKLNLQEGDSIYWYRINKMSEVQGESCSFKIVSQILDTLKTKKVSVRKQSSDISINVSIIEGSVPICPSEKVILEPDLLTTGTSWYMYDGDHLNWIYNPDVNLEVSKSGDYLYAELDKGCPSISSDLTYVLVRENCQGYI